ncbi:hypothetical protein AFB00_19610 [Pseudonocardia sp. HH130630-07]|nr:hypothetical protein AFB00_19610 [Pseudonocardia sp. HH130630-07]
MLAVVAAVLVGATAVTALVVSARGADRQEASAAPAGRAAPVTGTTVDGSDVLVFGDSVARAAKPVLQQRFRDVEVDADVGRQLRDLDAELGARAAAGNLRPVVVVVLGTNGTTDGSVVDRALDAVGNGHRLVLVLPHGDRDWTPDVQEQLRAAAARNPDAVRLADWDAAAGRVTGFAPDGVHPGEQGSGVLADVLAPVVAEARTSLP